MKKNYSMSSLRQGRLQKFLLFMTLKIFVLTLSLSTVCAAGFSQSTMNVSFSNERLETVLDYLERNSDYTFLYREGLLNGVRVGDVRLSNATIEEVLDIVLKSNGFGYNLTENNIVVVRKETVQQPQALTITGTVTDGAGNPVPGAAVLVKGTQQGTSADAKGNFSLRVTGNNAPVLVISFLGKKPVEHRFDGRQGFTVVLEDDSAEIEDVVVTGIFTKARESYTGAAKTITAAELRQAGNRSLLTSIANIDPSFNIAVDLVNGSDPNALPSITMRGNTSIRSDLRDLQTDTRNQDRNSRNLPLFILDGFEINLERMIDLDENQISSITLLKDASATAMYGTRGANGVVVITSILPAAGKLRVTYKGDLSVEAPDLTSYNLMNAREKLQFELAAGLYVTNYPSSDQEMWRLYNQRLMNVERGIDTYWLKYPVHTGVGNKHSVRVDGGGEDVRFGVGLQYNNVEGAMKGSGRNTLNGNAQINYTYKTLSFQNNLQVTDNKATSSPYGKFEDWTKIKSYYTPYDENGDIIKILEDQSYSLYSGGQTNDLKNKNFVYNPLWNSRLNSKDETKYRLIKNDFAIDWKALPELTLRARFSVSARNYRGDKYKPSDHTSFAEYSGDDIGRKGTYEMSIQETIKYEGDLTLSYNKVFREKHQLYAGLSMNIGQEKYEGYEFVAEGISNPTMDFMGMAALYKKDAGPTGDDQFSRRVGSTLNINYTYDRRYFVDVTGTLEASSKFGADNRTAPFFSTGVGWNIHQENFMASNRIFDQARLRMSYGTSGSQEFNSYQALRTYTDYGDVNYMGWYGAYMRALGNKDLGWQKTNQMNIGTDINVLNNRIQFTFDFYNKLTKDLLSDITVPSAIGFNSYLANIGKVLNRGYEINLNTVVVRDNARRIQWTLGGALIYNKNTIKEISDTLEFLNEQIKSENELNPSLLYEEGKSMNTIYAVRSQGIDPATGKEIFVKRDGTLTYTWDAADMVSCGINQPPYKGNVTTLFRFRNWTLNAIFSYYWGGQMYNHTLASKVENISPYDNADRRAFYNRWKNPGDHAEFKRVSESTYTRSTTRFVMDDKIFTLKNLKLDYSFDGKWMERAGMSYLNLSFSTEDVFVVSSIKQERGTGYPFSRKYFFTASFAF